MENILGKEVRHIMSGLRGIVILQVSEDFTLYEVDTGKGIAIWRYDHMETIPEEEIEDELEKLGQTGQPSNEGSNN